jgi:sugar phosphate isomerase/epimerase
MGLGLWIPAAAAAELEATPEAAAAFGQELRSRGLEVFTLNGFPFGDFHRDRVKEQVFLPAWDDPRRLDYTLRLGRLLASWLDETDEGSISTLACGFERLHSRGDFTAACARQLLTLAAAWHQVEMETGRRLTLGLEPEPGSTLETTAEVVAFFERELLGETARSYLAASGLAASQVERVVRRHLGVCYDACHQAVEFEDAAVALGELESAGIAIAKLQVTSALEVEAPGRDPKRLALLERFAEPRYLHQVTRRGFTGVDMFEDLGLLLASGDSTWLEAERWRIHFHVPVHRETVSGFETTRGELQAALDTILARDMTRHLEVETYTWGVLPDEVRAGEDLSHQLAEELIWTRRQLEARGAES